MNVAHREEFDAGGRPAVGNPMLARVRDFIDADEAPPALDPLGIARRALRGRERPVALAMALIALLLALVVFLAVKPAYQSSGLIRVLPREARTLYVESDDSRLRLYDAFVAAEMELLLSRPVLEGALAELQRGNNGLERLPGDVGELARMLGVSGKKGLIAVAARSPDAALSAAAVNALLGAYENNNEAARSRHYEVRRGELVAREKSLEESLASLDAQYLAIGREHDRGSLSRAHVARTAEIETLDERIAELDNTISQIQATGGVGADVGSVEIQRATLLDQATADMTYERARRMAALETLRGRYLPSHPKLKAAEGELAVLESAIAERREQIATLGKAGALTGSGAGSAQQSLADLETLRAKLDSRREAARREAGELNARLVHIGTIATEQARVAELLKETKRVLDEVTVESQNDLSRSVEIIARGKVADGPIEDKRKPLALGAAVAGALGTLAWVILGSLLAGRVRYTDDLDPRTGELLAAVAGDARAPREALDDLARRLRNELDLRWSQRVERPLVIGVTSVAAGCGATSVTEALARVHAAAGSRVLMVDLDGACNELSRRHLGQVQAAPVDAVALGHVPLAEALRPLTPAAEKIELLAAPRPEASAPRELSAADLGALIERVRERCDVLVLDLGVLAAGRQSAVGVAVADRALLIAAPGQRQRRMSEATALLERLAPARALLAFNRALALDPALAPAESTEKTFASTAYALSRFIIRNIPRRKPHV